MENKKDADSYSNESIAKLQLVCSSKQTKKWRTNQSWYINGKKNECELYQLRIIETLTKKPLIKHTNLRFNIIDYTLSKITKPNNKDNGFEYTEDIDAKQTINDITLYYNLKMCCDKGGAQTRTLREVYHYILCQLEYLLINDISYIYFINILDGDECYRNIHKFNYLFNIPKYNSIKKYVFIGNMKQYVNLWNKYNGDINQLING
jgi:hypothetical protein